MTASELKAGLAKQLRDLALWRGRKTASRRLEEKNWESMDALLALADALGAVPDTRPALLDILALQSAESPSTSVPVSHNVVFRAVGFAAIEGGNIDVFLDQIAQAMWAQQGKVSAR